MEQISLSGLSVNTSDCLKLLGAMRIYLVSENNISEQDSLLPDFNLSETLKAQLHPLHSFHVPSSFLLPQTEMSPPRRRRPARRSTPTCSELAQLVKWCQRTHLAWQRRGRMGTAACSQASGWWRMTHSWSRGQWRSGGRRGREGSVGTVFPAGFSDFWTVALRLKLFRMLCIRRTGSRGGLLNKLSVLDIETVNMWINISN